MLRVICIAVTLSVAMVGHASADMMDLVGVNFTGNTQSPTNWTRISSATPSTIHNLIDESGAHTNVSIQFSAPRGGEAFFSGSGLTASTVPMHTPSLAALNGNVDSTSPNSVFDVILGGLTPDALYDVWVFAARFAG